MARYEFNRLLEALIGGGPYLGRDATSHVRFYSNPSRTTLAQHFAADTGGTGTTADVLPSGQGRVITYLDGQARYYGEVGAVGSGINFIVEAISANKLVQFFTVKHGVDDNGAAVSDDAVTINAKIDEAVAAGAGSVWLRGEAYTCLSPVIRKDGVILRGMHKTASILNFPNDLGWNTYAMRGSPSGAGQSAAPELRDLAVFGPGNGQPYVPGAHYCNMDGIELLNAESLTNVIVAGFNAGIVFRQDHNHIDGCQSSGNFYGCWWKDNKLSAGNQSFIQCNLTGNLFATFAVGGDNAIDGCTFINCDLGTSPIQVYKTDLIERRVFDVVTNGTTTITSATAAFHTTGTTDVGKSVNLDGFKTTIASVTNATTAVLAAIPAFDVAPLANRTAVNMGIGTPSLLGMISESVFINTSFEASGNYCMLDDSTGGGSGQDSLYHGSMEEVGFSDGWPTSALTTRARDWRIKVRNINGFRLRPGTYPFTTGTVGVYSASSIQNFDIDGFVVSNMFGSGSSWSSWNARVRNMNWTANVENCGGTVTAGDLLEWQVAYNTVWRFGTQTNHYAGVALTSSVSGGTVLVATAGEVTVTAETSNGGSPMTMYATTPHHAITTTSATYTNRATTELPDKYPIFGYSNGPGGGSGGGNINVFLGTPHDQPGLVWPDPVSALPTAVAALRGQHIRIDGGAGVADIEYVCEKDGLNTYRWQVSSSNHPLFLGTAPTAAAGANAGASPPAPVVAATSNDGRGSITHGTGTGPAAGAQAVVTYAVAYLVIPYVTITPLNAATAALQPYVSATALDTFTVAFGVAPAASQANTVYAFAYQVAG